MSFIDDRLSIFFKPTNGSLWDNQNDSLMLTILLTTSQNVRQKDIS